MLKSYIAFDLETTGLSPQEHEIIEIGEIGRASCRERV